MGICNRRYDWVDRVILIVEDEPICQLFFKSILQSTDVKLHFASDGKQAINIVARTLDIDLILMDIKLPLLNGIEATMEIKKIRPELPIIMQTAYAYNNERERAMQAGCNDYITKPIHIETLLGKMDRFL